MHVGALTIFEGPPPPYTEVLDTLRGRLHLVPRYRQKLAVPPAGSGPARCGSTTRASTSSTTCATPRCRSRAPRSSSCCWPARIFSQQLDRSKPLWEVWMVEGLEDGGFALITKTHHALIDGIAGVDIAQVMFDLGPVPAEVPHPDEAWRARARRRSGAQVARRGDASACCAPACARPRAAAALATRPPEALRSAREAVEGLGEIVVGGAEPGARRRR